MKLSSNTSLKRSIILHWGILVAMLVLLSFGTSSCVDECETITRYVAVEPIYRSLSEIRNEVGVVGPEEIQHPGKIFWRDGYFFINESGKGIHVINNIDPENPVIEAFINIPGNFELAVQGNILYADSYVDLLAIDISNVSNPVVTHRIDEVFMEGDFGYYMDANLGLLVGYEENAQVVQEVSECASQGGMFWGEDDVLFARVDLAASPDVLQAEAGNFTGQGVGGSMARFTLTQGYLYAISTWQLYGFDLSNPYEPQLNGTTDIGWGIETVYPYKDMLFMGANDGMYIYDVANPASPAFLSQYNHIRACDPVIVDNDIAYLTLRDGSTCQNFTNQLEVIDISNPTDPQVMSIHSMDHPQGLAKEGNKLYICEGAYGLKSFDASDHEKIGDRELDHVSNIHAYDVIAINGIVMMVGQDGFYQYRCSPDGQLTLISFIPVENIST